MQNHERHHRNYRGEKRGDRQRSRTPRPQERRNRSRSRNHRQDSEERRRESSQRLRERDYRENARFDLPHGEVWQRNCRENGRHRLDPKRVTFPGRDARNREHDRERQNNRDHEVYNQRNREDRNDPFNHAERDRNYQIDVERHNHGRDREREYGIEDNHWRNFHLDEHFENRRANGDRGRDSSPENDRRDDIADQRVPAAIDPLLHILQYGHGRDREYQMDMEQQDNHQNRHRQVHDGRQRRAERDIDFENAARHEERYELPALNNDNNHDEYVHGRHFRLEDFENRRANGNRGRNASAENYRRDDEDVGDQRVPGAIAFPPFMPRHGHGRDHEHQHGGEKRDNHRNRERERRAERDRRRDLENDQHHRIEFQNNDNYRGQDFRLGNLENRLANGGRERDFSPENNHRNWERERRAERDRPQDDSIRRENGDRGRDSSPENDRRENDIGNQRVPEEMAPAQLMPRRGNGRDRENQNGIAHPDNHRNRQRKSENERQRRAERGRNRRDLENAARHNEQNQQSPRNEVVIPDNGNNHDENADEVVLPEPPRSPSIARVREQQGQSENDTPPTNNRRPKRNVPLVRFPSVNFDEIPLPGERDSSVRENAPTPVLNGTATSIVEKKVGCDAQCAENEETVSKKEDTHMENTSPNEEPIKEEHVLKDETVDKATEKNADDVHGDERKVSLVDESNPMIRSRSCSSERENGTSEHFQQRISDDINQDISTECKVLSPESDPSPMQREQLENAELEGLSSSTEHQKNNGILDKSSLQEQLQSGEDSDKTTTHSEDNNFLEEHLDPLPIQDSPSLEQEIIHQPNGILVDQVVPASEDALQTASVSSRLEEKEGDQSLFDGNDGNSTDIRVFENPIETTSNKDSVSAQNVTVENECEDNLKSTPQTEFISSPLQVETLDETNPEESNIGTKNKSDDISVVLDSTSELGQLQSGEDGVGRISPSILNTIVDEPIEVHSRQENSPSQESEAIEKQSMTVKDVDDVLPTQDSETDKTKTKEPSIASDNGADDGCSNQDQFPSDEDGSDKISHSNDNGDCEKQLNRESKQNSIPLPKTKTALWSQKSVDKEQASEVDSGRETDAESDRSNSASHFIATETVENVTANLPEQLEKPDQSKSSNAIPKREDFEKEEELETGEDDDIDVVADVDDNSSLQCNVDSFEQTDNCFPAFQNLVDEDISPTNVVSDDSDNGSLEVLHIANLSELIPDVCQSEAKEKKEETSSLSDSSSPIPEREPSMALKSDLTLVRETVAAKKMTTTRFSVNDILSSSTNQESSSSKQAESIEEQPVSRKQHKRPMSFEKPVDESESDAQSCLPIDHQHYSAKRRKEQSKKEENINVGNLCTTKANVPLTNYSRYVVNFPGQQLSAERLKLASWYWTNDLKMSVLEELHGGLGSRAPLIPASRIFTSSERPSQVFRRPPEESKS